MNDFTRKGKTAVPFAAASIALILALSFAWTESVFAQDAPPSKTDAPAPAATTVGTAQGASGEAPVRFVADEMEAEELGPKNKQFMQLLYDYRNVIKKLHAHKLELPGAKPARQEEIQKEYAELIEKGNELNKKMIEAGLEAFDEAPGNNVFVNNYLFLLVQWEYARENYELAYRMFKRLADRGIPNEAALYCLHAGLSAMMIMQLDDAEAWLKTAGDAGFMERFAAEMSETKKGREQLMSLEGLIARIPEFRKDWAREEEVRKAETEAGEKDPAKKLPRVLLKTSKGDIVVELFENEAPNTVASFISLVEKGFYNGTVFHRVLPMFMAQGGDPTGTGMGGPGYRFDDECRRPDARKHFRGSLSMANSGPNTNGSQFFLTFIPTYFLDGRHTVFGRVVDGFDVLADIQRVDPADEESMVPALDKIEEAKVLNKRDHAYEPVKRPDR